MKIYRQEIRNFHSQKFTVIRNVFSEDEYENLCKSLDIIMKDLMEDGITEENIEDADLEKEVFILKEYLEEEITRKEKFDDGKPTLTWMPEMVTHGIAALLYMMEMWADSIESNKKWEESLKTIGTLQKERLLLITRNKLLKAATTSKEVERADKFIQEVIKEYNKDGNPEGCIGDYVKIESEG